jgi:hypothetical protein
MAWQVVVPLHRVLELDLIVQAGNWKLETGN